MSTPQHTVIHLDALTVEKTKDVQVLLDEALRPWKEALEAEGVTGEVYLTMTRDNVVHNKVVVYAEIRPEQPLAKVIPITRGIK